MAHIVSRFSEYKNPQDIIYIIEKQKVQTFIVSFEFLVPLLYP